ncbi:MAG: ribonuclease PH [Phycisphaerae bacterium]
MPDTPRHDGRACDQLRDVTITPDFVRSAYGSCLIEMGNTRVICTASFEPQVPSWRIGSGCGWVTAEYGMLPASTGRRKGRPIAKPDSRAVEIQRLIGRVLRNAVDLDATGEVTFTLDCDVLEADGGTRTAGITGAYVALVRAINRAAGEQLCPPDVLRSQIAAVSVGIVAGQCVLDLDYAEDAAAEVDMNVAIDQDQNLLEVQGTGEKCGFTRRQTNRLLDLAAAGVAELMQHQNKAIQGA